MFPHKQSLKSFEIYINHNSWTCRPVNQLCNSAGAQCGGHSLNDILMSHLLCQCQLNSSLAKKKTQTERYEKCFCPTHVGEKLTGVQVRLFAPWWERQTMEWGVTTLTGGGVAHRHDLCYTAADGSTQGDPRFCLHQCNMHLFRLPYLEQGYW